MDKIPLTVLGHARLEAELKKLKNVDRPAVVQAIAEAREHGDLKENAEYHAAKDKQSFIEGRVKELESVLSYADVIDPSEMSGVTVRFGATMRLIDEETEEEVTYQIVGEYEADLQRGQISNTAPIARALIGKQAGDSVEVQSPKGLRYYEIITVEYK